jgi:hypothetical protein
MRERIEKVVGFIFVIAMFLGGITACGWYITQNRERQTGALAVAIGLLLITATWLWLKGRMLSND